MTSWTKLGNEPVSLTAWHSLRAKGWLASLRSSDKEDVEIWEKAKALAPKRASTCPSPIALRLCAARIDAMRDCLDAIIEEASTSIHLLNLGAGLDAEMLRIYNKYSTKIHKITEVDISETILQLKKEVLPPGFPIELRKGDSLDWKEAPSRKIRRIAVSEMVLPYLKAEAVAKIRRDAFETSDVWIEFSVLLPKGQRQQQNAFTEALARGFARSHSPILSAPNSLDDWRQELLHAGFSFVSTRSLASLSNQHSLSMYENEIFDEHAALDVLLASYGIAIAYAPKKSVDGISIWRWNPADTNEKTCIRRIRATTSTPLHKKLRHKQHLLETLRFSYEAAMRPESQSHDSIAKQVKATLKTTFASLLHVEKNFKAIWFVLLPPFADIIGCVALSKQNHIRCLAVSKPFRRYGIGTMLMDALEVQAGDLSLETIDCMTAALAFYQHRGYSISQRKRIEPKAKTTSVHKPAFDIITLTKQEPIQNLVAFPLLLHDAAIPKLYFDFIKPLEASITFRLPQPLYPRLSLVFQLGGRRYLARRGTHTSTTEASTAGSAPTKQSLPTRTIPAGHLVQCQLHPYAEPVPSFPRSINTFRRKSHSPNTSAADGACALEDGEPCTCNAECSLS